MSGLRWQWPEILNPTFDRGLTARPVVFCETFAPGALHFPP
jgi:hypothetical protein